MNKIHASAPADVVNYVSHALGYTPCESFVFMRFNGNAMSASLRIDAPAGTTRATDWPVRGVSYLPNDEDADRAVNAEMILRGSIRTRGQQHRPRPEEDTAEQIKAAAAEFGDVDGTRFNTAQMRQARAACAEATGARTPPEEADAVELIAMLVKGLRDRIMRDMLNTTDDLTELGAVMVGESSTRPDWDPHRPRHSPAGPPAGLTPDQVRVLADPSQSGRLRALQEGSLELFTIWAAVVSAVFCFGRAQLGAKDTAALVAFLAPDMQVPEGPRTSTIFPGTRRARAAAFLFAAAARSVEGSPATLDREPPMSR